jgi:hypothetical protein
MKPRYQEPSLVERCNMLDELKWLPGMEVCERRCLSVQDAPNTIAQHPDFEYAILMPWMTGSTWYDVLQNGQEGAAMSSPEGSLAAAVQFANVLASLEQRGVAHCDLSAGNVIVENTGRVALVDVEDVYMRSLTSPASIPAGTPGYQHRTSSAGMWRPDADRFAGAVLIAEMLGWSDPDVRAAAYGESYFDPREMQQLGTSRLGTLLAALRRLKNGIAVATLLERAWAAATLEECPPLGEWKHAVDLTRMGVSFSGRRIEAQPRARPTVFWNAIKPAERPRARVTWNTTSVAPPLTPVPASSNGNQNEH